MNKNILLGTIVSLGLLASFTGCKEEYTVYNGPQYIMFADTLSVLGVENNEEYFDINISGTKAMDEDCTLAVEVVETLGCRSRHIPQHTSSTHGSKTTRVRAHSVGDQTDWLSWEDLENIAEEGSPGDRICILTKQARVQGFLA